MEREMTLEEMRAEFVGWSVAWVMLVGLFESGLWVLLPAMKRKLRTRGNLPSPEAIAAYWQARTGKLGVFHDWQHEVHAGECFACGDSRRVARCHIVPHAHGGENGEWSLVLLCPRCHEDSEHLPEQVFWGWMNNQRRDVWETPIDHHLRRVKSLGLVEMGMAAGVDFGNKEAVRSFLKLALAPWAKGRKAT
jgi:5-methylcytosine-specific restriction endonuclease McrA